MIPGIGTLINSFGVLFTGVLTRLFIKKEIKNFENNLLPLGLLVLTLGIRESLKSPDFITVLFAVLIGAVLGTMLRIEDRIKKFGEFLHEKFEKNSNDKNKFIESYLTASLVVITGPLAIVGPFLDVVEGNIELLIIKTALDCFLVIFIIFFFGVFIYKFFKNRLNNLGKNRLFYENKKIQIVNETFKLIKEIKVYMKETLFINKFYKFNNEKDELTEERQEWVNNKDINSIKEYIFKKYKINI